MIKKLELVDFSWHESNQGTKNILYSLVDILISTVKQSP